MIDGSVQLTGSISPTSTSDTYATHEAKYGKDGLRNVADEATRNTISLFRREIGMIVGLQDTGLYYKLINEPGTEGTTNTDWEEFGGTAGLWENYDIAPVVAVYATYEGIPAGCSTSILITADNIGVVGNLIIEGADGVHDINYVISFWNTNNTSETITLTSGDGTQVIANKFYPELTGGVDASPGGNSTGIQVIGSGSEAIGEWSIAGGSDNTTEGINSVIIGGENNSTMPNNKNCGIFVGELNEIHNGGGSVPECNAIIGGRTNITGSVAAFSMIGAGYNNEITAGIYNGIIGGSGNNINIPTATEGLSFIGGGNSNIITGNKGAIIGGDSNNNGGGFSSIVGGSSNIVDFGGDYSAIIAGKNNTIDGFSNSVVVGGEDNIVSKAYSVIIGGTNNNISGQKSTILGGDDNILNGTNSAIIAGRSLIVDGNTSLATGYITKASGNNSFVGGEGYRDMSSNSYYVTAGGNTSFNFSGIDHSKGLYSIVTGDYSAILGGTNHNVTGENSVILGGYQQALSRDNVVMVPELEISGNGSGIRLTTPDGTNQYDITIDNAGNLVSTLVV